MKIRIAIATFCLVIMMIYAALHARAQQADKGADKRVDKQADSQDDSQSRRSGFSIRIDTDMVVIDVTATDGSGAYVRDLRADEIQVFEDGQERNINFFRMNDEAALSRPLAVVFALDLSGSLRLDEMSTLRQAAMKFTELMKGDSVFAALTFNNKVKVAQDFTPDPAKISRAFEHMNDFEGSTRIYDALDRAITMLNRRAPRTRNGRPVRRVAVVITDGFDSASIIDRKEVIRRANDAGVTIYSVTLPSFALSGALSGSLESADSMIARVITPLDASRIVPATGGQDFSANARDFTPIFKALAEEIRASYALAYYPDNRDGKRHELRIKTSRPGVQIRASRTSYTAAPQ
ncbi:MAG: VWA domain-containing protein [Chloracidobacterium sp.]|nr:VWA domain-containing protein [Chloracidobacterium sp.]